MGGGIGNGGCGKELTVEGRAHFITFEGGEGAGKTTQIARLRDFLARQGIDALTTREPGGCPEAEKIRTLLLDPEADWDPLSETMLHYTARREHIRQTIAPAMERGQWVLCDRYADSTLAYQGYGMGVARQDINALAALDGGILRPDLTIIFDLPYEVGRARLQGRPGIADRYERLDESFHRRLRDAFLRIAREEPERCAVIDASANEEAVAAEIAALIEERFLS